MLAREFSMLNQEVGIFAGLHRNNYLASLQPGIVKGLKVGKYPPKLGRVFSLFNRGIGQLKIQSWKPDIIHETYYSSWPTLCFKAIRVTTVYDMIHELYDKEFSKSDKTTTQKKDSFSRVDQIISISESTNRDLIRLFDVDEAKISVVPLGVDLSAFYDTQLDLDGDSKPYLLYVGTRRRYKNFTGLINAFASSSRLKDSLEIIAYGGGPFNKAEFKLFQQLGLNALQVRQVSGNDQKLAQLYANAEAFVYPSLYEGFGLPPLEAMAAGCPVISSNTSSIPEVVRNAGEYFDPNDNEQIKIAIEQVVYSEERKNKLRSLGYENIKDFSWEKCAIKTLLVYQELLGKL